MSNNNIVHVSEQHPFYPDRQGILEFSVGEEEKIMVLSRPTPDEAEPKIFFMIRPDDMKNPDQHPQAENWMSAFDDIIL